MVIEVKSDKYFARTLLVYICYHLNFGLSEEEENKDVDVILSSDKLAAKNIGEQCRLTEECNLFDVHTICVNSICSCVEGFSLQIDKCLNASEVTDSNKDASQTKSQFNTHVLPLMIAMGIMFIGMCVALNLFSRARFRNSRSIFNSPHPRLMNIKLGDKSKRKRRRNSRSRSSQRRPDSPPISPQSVTAPLNATEQQESSVVNIESDDASKKLNE